jgi:hypothetical protein
MNKKLGYYTVGKKELESKIHACIFATHIANNVKENVDPLSLVKWHFNEDIFSNYNWLQEPEATLDQLYNKRARELREKYDYIIISYSGGADSHNVVMSFLRQNLHIDEIIVNCLDKGNEKFAVIDPNVTDAKYAHASEHKLQAIPRIKEIQAIAPQTKISVYDMTDHLFDSFANSEENWFLKMREELNPVDVTRYNYIHFSDFRKRVDKDKKIAVVMGIDKPKVVIDDTNDFVYLRFSDRLTNISPVGEYMKDYTNTTVEYFYWSPDACDMLCKQAHLIKKCIEIDPGLRNFFSLQTPRNMVPGFLRLVSERLLRPILYTTWNKTWFQADKGIFDWHTDFDTWFIDGYVDNRANLIWREGLKQVVKRARPFVYSHGQVYDGLISYYHNYKIGVLRKFDST